MGFHLVTWALTQNAGSAPAQHVLTVLAHHADDETFECWPSIEKLTEETRQNRKTMISNIKKLREMGLIFDTGKRKGGTKSIPIYRLAVPNSGLLNGQSIPKNGTALDDKQAQNRDTLPQEAVPFLDGSSTVFDPEAVPFSPAHKEEQSGNNQRIVITPAREVSGITTGRLPLDMPAEWKIWTQTEKGWNWKIMEPIWIEFQHYWNRQIGQNALNPLEIWFQKWKTKCNLLNIRSTQQPQKPSQQGEMKNVETL